MILFCYGTRPEYIKMKKLIELCGDNINHKVLFVRQHTDIVFGDYDYEIVISNLTNRLDSIVSSVLIEMDEIILDSFDYVMVQGDTATAFAVALSAYNHGVKVIHLEAGLRTYDKENPYPEEVYRQLISRIASVHLCPTKANADNLILERILDKSYVVGNTVLDNLLGVETEYQNNVLVTLHRRENHTQIERWFKEIDELANENPELEFLLPIHPNPNVKKHQSLLKYVKVVDPLSHSDLIDYLRLCRLVITDSGGIQEEGSFLNKKVIVCRKVTERQESLGIHSFLCGDPNELKDIFYKIKDDYVVSEPCPYGDGYSTEKIVNILKSII